MKPAERRRLAKLGAVFVGVLLLAGVVRPGKKPLRPPDPDAAGPSAAFESDGSAAPAAPPEALDRVESFVASRRRAATPTPRRDPFFLPIETAAGRALAALWRDADAAAAAATRPTEAPASRPVVAAADLDRLRGLRLLGYVEGPAGSGAAVVEGIGRVDVGAQAAGTPFVLRSVSAGRATFVAGDAVVELSLPKPQGGGARSENR